MICGIGASAGIATGPVFLYKSYKPVQSAIAHIDVRAIHDSKAEWTRIEQALRQGRREIQALRQKASREVGESEAAIFEAHELFLDDPEFLQRVHDVLDVTQSSAEYAWQEGATQFAREMREIGDDYLAARADDIDDVARRVLRILSGAPDETTPITEPVILVADDLTPSDTITLNKAMILSFCLAEGSATSHVAILAKALGIPAIVSLGENIRQLQSGMQVIINGANGEIFIDPDEETRERYGQQRQALERQRVLAFQCAFQPAITRDGKRVEVVANIGAPEDAAEALNAGAEGIGLLRTEFLFLNHEQAPDEDEQTRVYRRIFAQMGQRPVVVRTLDIGGDKPAPYLTMPHELNPFLGIRGVRLTLAYPELFQTQLRALLRAAEGRNLKLMFPMIATPEEIRSAREQVALAQKNLKARGVSFAHHFEIGMMVEIPAAAVLADIFARDVDFFSIGTNDLVQYTLAADRTNAAIAPLADALHPAVLRLICLVIEAAHQRGRWVGVCGELAGDVLAVPVLLGLGLDEFSATPKLVPFIKQAIRNYRTDEARQIADHVLTLANAHEVRAYLQAQGQC
jgi:phosphoenolpyruvate-protein phosphotransferase